MQPLRALSRSVRRALSTRQCTRRFAPSAVWGSTARWSDGLSPWSSECKRSFAVSAKLIKQLRNATGAPIKECKATLAEIDVDSDELSDSHIQEAIDILRKKGVLTANKRADKDTSEGMVGSVSVEQEDGVVSSVAICRINCETDFVARNEEFQQALADITVTVADADASSDASENITTLSADEVNALIIGGEDAVSDRVLTLVTNIRESINVHSATVLRAVDPSVDVVASYVHHPLPISVGAAWGGSLWDAQSVSGGQIATGVVLKCQSAVEGQARESLAEYARKLAIHVCSQKPVYVSRDDVPGDVVEKEKEILAEQAQAMAEQSGKPLPQGKHFESMMRGRLEKQLFRAECLLEQEMITADEELAGSKVGKTLDVVAKNAGLQPGQVTVTGFTRVQVGV